LSIRTFAVLLRFLLTYPVKDIDQLKKTMALTGTPGPTLLEKITSEEVQDAVFYLLLCRTKA